MSRVKSAIAAITGGVTASTLESADLEFKEEASSIKQTLEILADAVVCLANAAGGTVVVGVSDSVGGPGGLLGVRRELSVDMVIRGVFDRTRPSLSIPVREFEFDGHRLLELTVPRGATIYANAKGTATRRVGHECRPFPPDEQRQALAARGLHDWSSMPTGCFDVSEEEVDRMRRLLRAANKSDLAAADTARLLSDMRLTTDGGDLTMAGLLLVGRREDIAKRAPTYGYAYQYRQTPGGEATAHFREARPILAAIERLLDAIEARRNTHPLNIAGGVQLQLHDYPSDAVRELVVNGLVHRDYEFDGALNIDQSPERLRVTSPGGLVFGVTPDNILTHPSTPRNRLLLEAVTSLQVAERTGQGIDRAYRELLKSGKKPPSFADDGTSVDVMVAGGSGNDAFTRFVSTQLPEDVSPDIDVLLALDYLCTNRAVDAPKLAPLVQRSVAEAQTTLERMAALDLVEPSRRTARQVHPNYGLSPLSLAGLGRSVVYHRRTADGIDQKVVEHVTEYGYITNQTIRRLFDLDVYAARDLLKDLQRRNLIVKLIPEARGPGVKYGPADQLSL